MGNRIFKIMFGEHGGRILEGNSAAKSADKDGREG